MSMSKMAAIAQKLSGGFCPGTTTLTNKSGEEEDEELPADNPL